MKARNNFFAMLVVLCVAVGLVFVFEYLQGLRLMGDVFGVDYLRFFRAAFYAEDPYAVPGFYNPFWIFGFTALAEFFGRYGLAVWMVLNLCAFLWVCLYLKMPLWLVLPFFVFSGALMGVLVGNVEGLVALGLVLPSPLALIVLMVKPQIGAAVAAHLILSAFVEHGWRRAVWVCVPVGILFAVSFGVYGNWMWKAAELVGRGYNTIDFFPLGVPLGVALVVAGVSRRNVGYALMAIPFTTPYMIFHTWAFPFLGVVLVLKEEFCHLRALHFARVVLAKKGM